MAARSHWASFTSLSWLYGVLSAGCADPVPSRRPAVGHVPRRGGWLPRVSGLCVRQLPAHCELHKCCFLPGGNWFPSSLLVPVHRACTGRMHALSSSTGLAVLLCQDVLLSSWQAFSELSCSMLSVSSGRTSFRRWIFRRWCCSCKMFLRTIGPRASSRWCCQRPSCGVFYSITRQSISAQAEEHCGGILWMDYSFGCGMSTAMKVCTMLCTPFCLENQLTSLKNATQSALPLSLLFPQALTQQVLITNE